MELWFTEDQTKNLRISCRVERVLFSEKSPYQQVSVVETPEFGRMLLLDSVIQTSERDEFAYHEMISHVALNTHPAPRRVCVIGGGDGGTVREVLKHPEVEQVVLVEIDGVVVDAARRFLPSISNGLNDPRVQVCIADGIEHMREQERAYDVVLVDSTDPVGPAVGLFSADFYRSVYRALTDEGILVAQSESPFYNAQLISRVTAAMKESFPLVRLYCSVVPTYPGGLWCFTLGSKGPDPLKVEPRHKDLQTRFYSPEIHRAAFTLPPFVAELVRS